jgi:hypothetical protein
MSFLEAAKFIEKDGFDVALNPSGPVSVGLPSKAATELARLAHKIASGAKVNKETINDGSKVVVGVPRPGQETDDMRAALINYCRSNREIKKAGLLYMIREGKPSYLVIIDAPKGKESVLYAGLLAALKPHLKTIKKVDFSLMSEAPFAKDYFAKIPCDYSI